MAIGSTGGSDSLKVVLEAEDNASKVIEKTAEAFEKLDGKKVKVGVEADDKASKPLGEVADTAKKLDGTTAEVSVDADTKSAQRNIDDILEKVDKIGGEAANLILTSNASDIQREIADLVLDVQDLDSTSVEFQVKADRIQELEGDLDKLSSKAKELNGTPIELNTSAARTGLDDLGRSAGSSKSVLANMVGNATQDLGALGGVAGSAGVAIGQMGEYMVDAKNDGDGLSQVLSNFGKVAVPIAAITFGMSAIGSIFQAAGDRAERASEQVDAFTDSLSNIDDAKGAVSGLLDQMERFDADATTLWGGFTEGVSQAVAAVPLLGGVIGDADLNISNVIPTLNQLSISADDIAAAAVNGGSAWDNLQVSLFAANEAGQITNDQYAAASQMLKQFRGSAEDAAVTNEFLGTSTDAAGNAFVKVNEGALAAQQAFKDGAAAAKEQADAQAELEASLAATVEALDTGALAAEGFSSALDQINAASELDFSLMAINTVESFDSIKESLEAAQKAGVDWSKVDLTPDSVDELKGITPELEAVTKAVSGMRDSIQTELTAAFDTGGIQAYRDKATFFAGEIRDQFVQSFKDAGASEDEAVAKTEELLRALGLLPEQVEIQVKLTQAEAARKTLEIFKSDIDNLPPLVSTEIKTLWAQGSTVEALQKLNDYLVAHGQPPIPIDSIINPPADPPVIPEIPEVVIPSAIGATPADAIATQVDAAQSVVDGHPLLLTTDPAPAFDATASWAAAANATTATSTLEADPAPANADLDGWVAAAGAATGTANLAADDSPARGTVGDFVSTHWSTTIFGQGDMSDADSDAKSLGPYHPPVIGDYQRTDGVPSRITIPVILQAVNNFFRRGGTAPREGISIAGENYRPEILDDKYLISSPTVIRPGTKVTGEAETARILAGAGVSAKGGTMMRLHPETISAIAAAASRRPMVVEIDGRVVASKELRRSAQSVRAATTRMAVAKAMARR